MLDAKVSCQNTFYAIFFRFLPIMLNFILTCKGNFLKIDKSTESVQQARCTKPLKRIAHLPWEYGGSAKSQKEKAGKYIRQNFTCIGNLECGKNCGLKIDSNSDFSHVLVDRYLENDHYLRILLPKYCLSRTQAQPWLKRPRDRKFRPVIWSVT